MHGHLRVAHTDIKLENILVGQDNQAVVADFGVASTCGVPDEAESRAAHDAKLEAWREEQLRAGADPGAVDRKVEKQRAGLPALYTGAASAALASHRAFTASNDAANGAIADMPRPTVPVAYFFKPNMRQQGWESSLIGAIERFNPGNPLLAGEQLLRAFWEHAVATIPDDEVRGQYVRSHSAILARGVLPGFFSAASPDSACLTQPRQLSGGTIPYMCPLQRAGQPTLPFAADVYSLGISLFMILTKTRPYEPNDEIRYNILVQEGLRGYLTRCRTNYAVPEACIPILERMLAADPARRPSVHECIAALKPIQFVDWN
jgi:serine/threonine protein kinase